MARRSFAICCVVSLLLWVGVCVLGIGSYFGPSRIILDGNTLHNGSTETGSEWVWTLKSSQGLLNIHLMYSFYEWPIPYWRMFILFLVLPARWAHLRFKSRRIQSRIGLCQGCGYDLRASNDRCPECGKLIPQNVGV